MPIQPTSEREPRLKIDRCRANWKGSNKTHSQVSREVRSQQHILGDLTVQSWLKWSVWNCIGLVLRIGKLVSPPFTVISHSSGMLLPYFNLFLCLLSPDRQVSATCLTLEQFLYVHARKDCSFCNNLTGPGNLNDGSLGECISSSLNIVFSNHLPSNEVPIGLCMKYIDPLECRS